MENLELPHRFRESTFRDYEPAIAEVVNAFPNAVCFRPKHYNKTLSTFACRLRDSMQSFKEHNWTTEIIGRERFLSCQPFIKVSERSDGTVLAGSEQGIKNFTIGSNPTVPLTKPVGENAKYTVDCSLSLLEVLAQLSALRMLAPRIKLINADPAAVEELQLSYDIAFDKNSDNTYTLI